jgi:hypothetical protein
MTAPRVTAALPALRVFKEKPAKSERSRVLTPPSKNYIKCIRQDLSATRIMSIRICISGILNHPLGSMSGKLPVRKVSKVNREFKASKDLPELPARKAYKVSKGSGVNRA